MSETQTHDSSSEPEHPKLKKRISRKWFLLVLGGIILVIAATSLAVVLLIPKTPSAQSVLSSYCSAIVKKDYKSAYGLLSDSLKQSYSLTEYSTEEQTVHMISAPLIPSQYPTSCLVDSVSAVGSTTSATVYYNAGPSAMQSGEMTSDGTITNPDTGKTYLVHLTVTPKGIGFNMALEQVKGAWKLTKIEFS